MTHSWKPRHVIAIVGMISAAAVLAPVAVHAVDTQPVAVYDAGGQDSLDPNGDGSINVQEVVSGGHALHYEHHMLTPQTPAVVVSEFISDGVEDFFIDSIGVTASPTAKGASFVQFRQITIGSGQSCSASPSNVLFTTNLPALWVQPRDQAEYDFVPTIEFGHLSQDPVGHCLVAFLLAGGPVDAHATVYGLDGNF